MGASLLALAKSIFHVNYQHLQPFSRAESRILGGYRLVFELRASIE